MTNNLPKVFEFTDLHLTENQKAARATLNKLVFMPPTGVICNITGAMYIGSTINIAQRLVDHVVDNATNVHLKNAINHYELENFTFVSLFFC